MASPPSSRARASSEPLVSIVSSTVVGDGPLHAYALYEIRRSVSGCSVWRRFSNFVEADASLRSHGLSPPELKLRFSFSGTSPEVVSARTTSLNAWLAGVIALIGVANPIADPAFVGLIGGPLSAIAGPPPKRSPRQFTRRRRLRPSHEEEEDAAAVEAEAAAEAAAEAKAAAEAAAAATAATAAAEAEAPAPSDAAAMRPPPRLPLGPRKRPSIPPPSAVERGLSQELETLAHRLALEDPSPEAGRLEALAKAHARLKSKQRGGSPAGRPPEQGADAEAGYEAASEASAPRRTGPSPGTPPLILVKPSPRRPTAAAAAAAAAARGGMEEQTAYFSYKPFVPAMAAAATATTVEQPEEEAAAAEAAAAAAAAAEAAEAAEAAAAEKWEQASAASALAKARSAAVTASASKAEAAAAHRWGQAAAASEEAEAAEVAAAERWEAVTDWSDGGVAWTSPGMHHHVITM